MAEAQLIKTVLAAFHLTNREAGHKLNISLDRKWLSFIQIPTYLSVKLDWLLMYHQHHESLCEKLTSCIALMRRPVVVGWGTKTAVLQTAALALVYLTAETEHLSGVQVYTPTSLTPTSLTPASLTPASLTPPSLTPQLMMHYV